MSASAGLKTIESRKFRVGRIRGFNDPFEWRFRICGIVDEGRPVAEQCLDRFIEDIDRKFGIICFSGDITDPVLWAHYADNHKEVAFEVDYLNDSGTLHEVQYTQERPVFDANHLADPTTLEDHMKPIIDKMLYQKAPGWAYEKEYRVHISFDTCSRSGGSYFLPIPDAFVTRVVLGFDCPLEEDYIAAALSDVGMIDTTVVRGKMHETSYEIQC